MQGGGGDLAGGGVRRWVGLCVCVYVADTARQVVKGGRDKHG